MNRKLASQSRDRRRILVLARSGRGLCEPGRGFDLCAKLFAPCAALALSVALATAALPAASDSKAASASSKSSEPAQASSQPAPPAPVVRLPAYHNLRFEEDWSGLADTQRQGWDAWKNLPLDSAGKWRLTVGGQLRGRVEFWDGFAFSPNPAADDTFGLLRLRLHADLKAGPYVRLFVEGKSALADGRSLAGGNRTLDTDSAELQNALVDLRLPLEGPTSLTFRLGRQELQFGRQRLVSPLDWSNTRLRSFDGFRGIVRSGKWRADAFWTRFVRTRKYRFNNHDSGSDFFGLYAAGPLGDSGWLLDAYYLGLELDSTSYSGRTGTERRQTAGGRLSSQNARFDFDLESAAQWGSFADGDIRAWMLALQAGRSFPATKLSPRLYAGFDYASGDENPADARLETFNQLFPLGHAYLGYADFVGRQNILDFSQGASLSLAPGVAAKIEQHWFWRARRQDALYNAGGGVVRAGLPGSPRRVGAELDLTLDWKISRHLAASGGYSRFFTGPFLEATGPAESLNFGFAALQWTF